MKYIHYGHEKFDINLFTPIRNLPYFTKPAGGLWASESHAEYGWKEWCENNHYNLEDLEFSFEFTLNKTARILELKSENDLLALPKLKNEFDDVFCRLNFQKLTKDYDIIRYYSGDQKLYYKLYGWDCDSIVIMNPNVIIL